jgi:hypothetical protein
MDRKIREEKIVLWINMKFMLVMKTSL